MFRISVFILAALLTSPAFGEDSATPPAPSISATDLNAKRESGAAPIVIDVRTPEEYATGHVPGALNIPFGR